MSGVQSRSGLNTKDSIAISPIMFSARFIKME